MYGIELLGRQDALGPRSDPHGGGARLGRPRLAPCAPPSAPAPGPERAQGAKLRRRDWGGSLFRIAISTAPFLLRCCSRSAFGLDAFHSGLLVLTLFAGNLSMKVLTNQVLRRWGFRTTLIGNGLIVVVAAAACAGFTPTTPWRPSAAVLFVNGLARSMQFTSITRSGLAEIPAPQMSPPALSPAWFSR